MRIEYHKFRSSYLNDDFEFKAYGHAGKALIVFPCSQGRFYDYESRGMFHVLYPFIDNGDIRVFTVDSRDSWSWFSGRRDSEMGKNHWKYEMCITREFAPMLKHHFGIHEKFISTGNSWGAYHALNFLLKYPWIFDTSVSLSGNYSLREIVGNYYDNSVYFNDILMYMKNMSDENILRRLRQHYAVICHGTGAWEISNHESAEAARLLKAAGVPCWYDIWGKDYPHDWPSWKKQIPKYMHQFRNGVMTPQGVQKIIGPERRRHWLEI